MHFRRSKILKTSHLVALLATAFLAFGPLISNLAAKGKPAKISWSVSRITESMLEEGSITVEFTSDQDVLDGVTVRPTPSLRRTLDVEPSGYDEILAGEVYEVTVSVKGEEGLTQTTGGTIHIKQGSRTLARPLNVSLKVEEEDDDDDIDDDDDADDDDDLDDDEDGNTITWNPEIIDATTFEASDIVTVEFSLDRDLDRLCVWITPSASGNLTAEPSVFEGPLTALDEEGEAALYSFDLTLEPSFPELTKDLGGTIHLRACDESGKLRRTYDEPLPIEIEIEGDDDDDEEPLSEAVPDAVVSAADYEEGAVAPGQIISIFGEGIGPKTPAVFDGSTGQVGAYLGDTQVFFDGIGAPLLVASSGQVNAIAPQALAGKQFVEMRVTHLGKVSAPILLPAASAAPSLFTVDQSGSGQGAFLNADGSLNGPGNGARRGTIAVLYGTGGGLTVDPPEDGAIVTGEGLPLLEDITVTVNGQPAEVLWAGSPPGAVYGVLQINIRLPFGGVRSGPNSVVVTVDGEASSDRVTVEIH